MSTRPFLEDIEKKWLAFQLLCAVRDCHSRDVFHGDIKTENTLVTSWNWLYLSDFSSSFKPTQLPEDNPADFSYYFDTAGRRTCYLAPERFVAAGEAPDPKKQVDWAMDIFSAGCVIAELFLEAPIFNLSQLYSYKKKEYNPVTSHLIRIADKDIREMVAHMIQLEPESRYSADEYLNFWKGKVFPEYFYDFLHQYMHLITDPSSGRSPVSSATANLGEADERIDRIYYDFDKISYLLGYGIESHQPGKRLASKASLDLLPVQLNIPNNEHQVAAIKHPSAVDGTLIFSTLVVSSLRNTARASARIRACDLLLAFAERLTDEAKVDRILPYLVSLLNDKTDIVKMAATRTVTQLMALVTVISPVNAHVFPEYILPRMQNFVINFNTTPSPLVRATYAACLGSLATTASRYLDLVATLRADGTLPTSDPETENAGGTALAFHGLFDNSRAELLEIFEAHTKSLITDSDSAVRRAFLGSVPELCMFFGTAEANDIILTHLNTYLNDRDWMLKCAFFEKIVAVATFLGGTSLEEFILPLMVQALTDPEEFVVERVLRSLASLAELGLFQRTKIWELVDVVGRFTMHPNIWIREAAAMFIAAATGFLSPADCQCIILPLISPYLKGLIREFSELDLLDALKKPLSRPVFDLAANWALKVDKGIFWKPVRQMRTFSFGTTGNMIPTISAKDLGSNALKQVPKNDEDEQWLARLRNIGMGPDDEFKLLALREYIWRMAPAKARDSGSSSSTSAAMLNNVINIRDLKITPQTVMFEEQDLFSDRTKGNPDGDDKAPHTIADALLDASMTIDDSISRRRRSAINSHRVRLNSQQRDVSLTGNGMAHRERSSAASPSASPQESSDTGTRSNSRRQPSLVPTRLSDDDSSLTETDPGQNTSSPITRIQHKHSAISLLNRRETSKSTPETGTTSANAFGRVEGPFTTNPTPSPTALAQSPEDKPRARFRAPHTYTGNDPSILKMLDSVYAENYPSDLAEFGPLVTPLNRRKSINRSGSQSPDKPWRPAGVLVATFSEHIGPVSRVVVAADHVFFITGGDDGTVKVWDTARLERNIAHRSRQTHKHAPGAKITALCFVENTHCFVSCGSDGSVNVVRVYYDSNGGITRYTKLQVLREYQLPGDEVAIWCEHFKHDTSSLLLLATNRSRIIAIDLRNMKVLYVLENPVHHGTPTCFVTDKKHTWLLLGTSHGVLDLWDLRFLIRLKAWGLPGATPVYRITLHPFKGRGRWVCVAGGSGQGEVTVWDVEKTQCREVYRTAGSSNSSSSSSKEKEATSKSYEPWPVDEDRPEGMLGRFATALDMKPSGAGAADRGIRAMAAGSDIQEDGRESKTGFLVTGGSDRKIRFWDLQRVDGSRVVSGLETDEPKPTYSTVHLTASLCVNSEHAPRPAGGKEGAGVNGKDRGSATGNSRPPRSTVISLQQQQLLKTHLDSVLDVALLESPYGMTVSVDRSGVVYVFQ